MTRTTKKAFCLSMIASLHLIAIDNAVAMEKFDTLITADRKKDYKNIGDLFKNAINSIIKELENEKELKTEHSGKDSSHKKSSKMHKSYHQNNGGYHRILLDRLYYLSADGINYAIQKGVFSEDFGEIIKTKNELKPYEELKKQFIPEKKEALS